jgi:hypothetical protein
MTDAIASDETPSAIDIPEEKQNDYLSKGMTKYALKKLLKWGAYAKLGPFGGAASDIISDAIEKPVKEYFAPLLGRVLSGSSNINPEAFNAVLNVAESASRGLNLVNSSVRDALAGKVASYASIPDSKIKKLENAADLYQSDPTKFLDMGQNLAHYEPVHAAAQNGILDRALPLIAQMKPRTQAMGILDNEIKPSAVEMREYKRGLKIIDDPLQIMNHVARGDISPNDVRLFHTVYPDLGRLTHDTITKQLIEMKAKNKLPPYKVRLGLSMLMGIPLDSTMTPSSIAMNQAKAPGMTQQQSQEGAQKQGRALKSLSSVPGIYATAQEAKEAKRALK